MSGWSNVPVQMAKKTVYIAQCKCGAEPKTKEGLFCPREHLCSCGKWVSYVDQEIVK